MDKYHAFELGLAFGKGMLLNNQSDRESLATDSEALITVKPHGKDADFAYDRWITIHPHGDDNRHIEIDDKTGEILKGLSPNLQGTHIYDLKENLKRLKEGKKPYTVADYPNGKNQPKKDTKTRDQKFADLIKLIRSIHHKTYVYDKDKLRSISTEDLIDDINAEFKTMPEIATGIEKELRANRNLDEDDITDLIDEETDKYIRKKCAEFAENDPVAKDYRDELKEIQEKYLPQIKELNKEVGEEVTKDQYQKADDLRRAYSREKNELNDKFKDKLDVPYTVPTQYWYDNKTDQQDNEINKLSQDVTNSYLNQEKARKKAENIFRKISPAGKFFGENGMEKYSNKYFTINHNPDKDTVILDNVADRLRVTGKGDLIFLTDKNKGYYINDKNSLPILIYHNEDNTHELTLAVKMNQKYLKEYTFTKEFAATDDIKPLNGFADLQEMAKEKDDIENLQGYRNVDAKTVDIDRAQYIDNLYKTQQLFRKPAERVTVTNPELNSYLGDWNKKIYKYGDGTKAIFSQGKKIILTQEQFEWLLPLEK